MFYWLFFLKFSFRVKHIIYCIKQGIHIHKYKMGGHNSYASANFNKVFDPSFMQNGKTHTH